MNAARWFQRREDYQPKQTPRESPFRNFNVSCLKCGSYQLRTTLEFDEQSGETRLLLLCNKCPNREIMAVR